jgi:DNA-binding CsgD family transcriptional regulator
MVGGAVHEDGIYERERELETVRAFVDRSLAGDGGLLAVEAGAGFGKTRLLDETARLANGSGARVLRASASELERDLPFGVMRQLFEPAWREADAGQRARWSEGAAALGVRLLTDVPPTRASPAAEPSFGTLHGIYWLAVAVAEDGATVLLVDDLHWADGPSVRALAYLARRLEGLPLGLVVSLRTGELQGASTVEAMLGVAPAGTVAPAALSEAGVGAAASEMLGVALPPGFVSACAELTGGNPLLVRQLLDAMREDGIDPSLEALEAFGRLAPSSLSRSVMLRVGRLGEEVMRLARVVAVLGDACALRHVAELTDVSPDAVLESAARLTAAGVFSDRSALAFAHPLVRAAVYADLSAPERALLHARAARLLAQDDDADSVAPHLLASEPAADPWVVESLRTAAGEASAKGAWAIAVTCLRRAVREPPVPELRADVLAELGIAERRAEEYAAAASHLREAVATELGPATRRDAAVALAESLVITEGTRSAVDALAAQRSMLAGDHALRLEIEQTMLGVFDPELAPWALERMLTFATLPGDTPTERYALANACVPLGMGPTARAADAVAVARRALADGALARDTETSDLAAGTALYPLAFAGELDLAEREAEHLLEHARARGSAWAFIAALCIRCDVFRMRGNLLAAAADAELTIGQCEQMPATPTVLRVFGITLCFAVDIELLRGNREEASRLVQRSCRDRDLTDPQMALFRQARGQVALHDGELHAAKEELAAAGAALDASGYEDRTMPWRLELARVHAALGDAASASRLADRQLELARTWGAPGGIGIALRVKALSASREDAERALRESIELLSEAGFEAQLAWSRIELGSLLRRASARIEAQELLRAGLDGAANCGARMLVERAHEELRVAGARPRRLAFSGLDSLTASERRVAEMAAGGMTNRLIAQELFVTPKTVEQHLTAVFRKLDLSTRRELPGALGGADG